MPQLGIHDPCHSAAHVPGRDNGVRKHAGPKLTTLTDYRIRLAQYRTDPHLAAMHARCPWFVTWDDHEVEDNYASEIRSRSGADPAEFLIQRANAYQAYYEAMPLRRRSLPRGTPAKIDPLPAGLNRRKTIRHASRSRDQVAMHHHLQPELLRPIEPAPQRRLDFRLIDRRPDDLEILGHETVAGKQRNPDALQPRDHFTELLVR